MSHGTDHEGNPALTHARSLTSRLDRAVRQSVADATEIVCIEAVYRSVHYGDAAADTPPRAPARTVPGDGAYCTRRALIRVGQGRRIGTFHTSDLSSSQLQDGIRQAIALSRLEPQTHRLSLPSAEDSHPPKLVLFDRRIARLEAPQAREWMASLAAPNESARLSWCEGQIVVINSEGLRRRAHVTTAEVEVRTGPSSARHAARTLRGLRPESAFARSRARNADPANDTGALFLSSSRPLLLAAEAVAPLIEFLALEVFSADAYRDGEGLLRRHAGNQVFDQAVALTDDATDPANLPFPFDLEGTDKRPVPLIAGGIVKTPALDRVAAQEFGLPSTGHAALAGAVQPFNLTLAAGELDSEQLMEAGGDGFFAGRIHSIECLDPHRILVRIKLGEVRRIAGGKLGGPLPDIVWEDSLLRALSSVLAIGRMRVCLPRGLGLLGGTTAPPLLIAEPVLSPAV